MTSHYAIVRLELDSRPECLTLIRGMLAGVAELLEFDPELLDDLKTAVREAANNVVLHAYGGEPGPLVVSLEVRDDGVEAIIRDHGSGIQQVSASDDRMGVGLAVISALADKAEFRGVPDGGTEVRMTFSRLTGTIQLPDRPVASDPAGGVRRPELAGDVVVMLSPATLLAGVLGRVTRALAAGARFSLDRFSDVYLVTDAIVAYADSATTEDRIGFAIETGERRLELTIGPFRPGSGAELRDDGSDPTRSPLALLADEVNVERSATTEMLRVVLLDRRGGPGTPS